MLETTLTSNASTASFSYPARSRGTFWATGTFGGGTIVLEASRNNGTTWLPVANTTLTVNGYSNFQLNGPYRLRVTLSGATSPNIFVAVDSIRSS